MGVVVTERLESGRRWTFRRVTRTDFPLLAQWLARPHVQRWWCHEFSADAVERDFGASADGLEPSQDWLALADGTAVGLIQRSRYADYPDYQAELGAVVEVPDEAVSLDYLLGDATLTGRGLGPALIAAFTAKTWADLPATSCVLIPINALNRASWRAVEKAGYRRVGSGDLTPDNPADPPVHFVYRMDRPR